MENRPIGTTLLPTTWFCFWLMLCQVLVRSVRAGDKAIGVAEAVRDLPDSIKTPNRYALVIGTGHYEDERIPALPAGPNDARRLHQVLTDPAVGMFQPENVTLLLDEAVIRLIELPQGHPWHTMLSRFCRTNFPRILDFGNDSLTKHV